MKAKKLYTLGEEIFSSVSHGIGIALASAALAIMLFQSAVYGTALAVACSIIYGISLILLFTSSTLYHAITNDFAKKVLRIIDHCAIFILIAGTYTPFTLITLKGSLGTTLFTVIWISAILGVVLNAIDLKKYEKASLVCYLFMGWAIVFAIKPLLAALATGGVILLVLGGAMYTIGIIFYVMKKFKYMHSVWHLFVLAGAVLHCLSVILYVIPTTY